MMTLTCLRISDKLQEEDYKYMISGLSGQPLQEIENPDPKFFSEKQWNNILHMNNLKGFERIAEKILQNMQ